MDIFPNKHFKRQVEHGVQNRQRQAQKNIVFNHFNNKHLRQLSAPVITHIPVVHSLPVSLPLPVDVSVDVSLDVSIPDPIVSAVSSVVENINDLQYIKDKIRSEYQHLYK